MPTALINGAEIYYEILGYRGPWVTTILGGRRPSTEAKTLARAIASRGYRVINHDRRNCGRSSLDFDTRKSEEDLWVSDLRALLDELNVAQAFVVGQSRGARIAIRFALRHPDKVLGLGLWGLSGGSLAAKFLDDYYYGKYLRACEKGGMNAVCALDHFAGLIEAKPANRDLLLAMDEHEFITAMNRWRDQFLIKIDQPVMGLNDEELRSIGVPTAIVPYYDRMHPHTSAAHAVTTIPGSRLFDFDPHRHDNPTMTADDESKDTATVAKVLCAFESALSPRREANAPHNLRHQLFSRDGFLSHLRSLPWLR